MPSRGSAQFLLLFLRSRPKLGWTVGAVTCALIAAVLLQAAGEFPLFARTGLAQMLRQSAWQHALAGLPAPEPLPWVSSTSPAAADVPLLGLSASVVRTDLDTAAVTPIVDETGSAPRNRLSEVGVGDKITVTTADGASRDYRVTGRKVVDPHLAETPPGPSDIDATLVTCMPLDPLLSSLSLVIQATKVDPPAATAPDPEQKL
jgi:sortase family protein